MKQDQQLKEGCQATRNVNHIRVMLTLALFIEVQFTNAQIKKEDMTTRNRNEATIRALEDRFVVAFNAGDIDAIMRNYTSGKDRVVFDLVPRKQYLGAEAYRKDWVDMFSHFQGTPKIAMTDLGIAVDGTLAFSHCFMHVTGTNKQGHLVDYTVRVTDGYRKIGENWLIALEHISVPVDLATGKAVLTAIR